MKTILFILDEFHVGGVTSFVKQYTQVALNSGHKVIILGFRGNLSNPQEFFKSCEVLVIDRKISYSLLGLIKCFFSFFPSLVKVLSFKKVNHIHFSMTWTTLFTFCYLPVWKLKRTITFYGAQHLESTFDIDEAGNSVYLTNFNYNLKSYFTRNAQLLSLNGCEVIITFSDYSKAIITQHFSKALENKIKVIPGLVNLQSDLNIREKKKKQTLTIVNFGRMDVRKGIDLLIKAGSILKNKKISFNIIIASPLVESELIRHYRIYENLKLSTSVHFIHGLTQEEKGELLQKADVFVMPSRDLETFGMTMLESLSFGVPVIGTPAGAIPEVLSKIDSRLIAKEINASELAKVLIWYYELKLSERQKLSRSCIDAVKLHYDFFSHQKEIQEIYD